MISIQARYLTHQFLNWLKSLSKYDKATILICFLSLIGYSSLALMTWNTWIPFGHYGNEYSFFAKYLAQNHSLIYVNPLNEYYTPIFTSNHFVQMGEKTLPSGYLGYTIILGVSYFVHPKFMLLITPIVAAVGLFFFFKLTSLIFSQKVGILSIGLLSVFPAYFWSSNTMRSDIPAFVFLVGGLYYFFRALQDGDKKINYILFAVFFALSIWMRYPNVILLLPLLPVLYLSRHKLRWSYLLLSGVVFLLCMSPLLGLNSMLYGGPFNLGRRSVYMVSSLISSEQQPEDMGLLANLFIPFKSLDSFAANIGLYIGRFCPLLLLFLLFGIITHVRSKMSYLQQQFFVVSSLTFVVLLLYYGGGTFYGAGFAHPAVGSSYLRYWIPVYAFFIVYASVFLVRPSWRRILPIFLIPFIVFSLVTSYFDGFYQERRGIEFLGNHFTPTMYHNSQLIIQNTEEEAVVFSRHLDWIIYPDRNTAIYGFIPKENQMDDFVKLIRQLRSDEIPVYFLEDDDWGSSSIKDKCDLYFAALDSEGFKRTLVSELENPGGSYSSCTANLWKIDYSN